MPAVEILREVVETPRRAYLPLPDLRVIERPGWLQLVTPSFRSGGYNRVECAALAADEADAVIATTIAEYRTLGVEFRWTVGPDSAPADLGERLARAGLRPTASRGMARSTELAGARDPAVEIVEVDARTVDDFTRVMAEGWGSDPAPLARAHGVALAHRDRQPMFLARLGGAPVAAAAYFAFPRSAYLLAGVVLPAFRGRGLYRALVHARLAHARARGLALATVQAIEATSAPLLERLGFATVCRITSYR